MHRVIAPVVEEALTALQLHDLNASQEFALRYLLRGYVVSRIVYMIEVFRGLSTAGGMLEEKLRSDVLNNLEPWGHA
jgi:hypothetical protein